MDSPIYEDLSPILKRARVVFILAAIVFGIVLFFYWKIQILDYKKFWSLAESNRTRDIVIPAPRALLTDRNGAVILANSIVSFKVSLIRENTRNLEESLRRISPLLGLDVTLLRQRIDKYRTLPAFRPIVVMDNLSLEQVSQIEGRRIDFPELVIEAEPKRFYPFTNFGAHVLGYMQELTPEDLRAAFKERKAGDMAGKTGIEGAYDARLAGVDGKLVEVVDSLGRKRDELERVEPQQSPKLVLTIDFDLQAKAEELLSGKEGAVVVLDARTGGVLTMASFPTYDPNKFINRFTPEEWIELVKNPDNPLINRAIQGQYSPGSIFKPAMALGALDLGIITEQTTFFCAGVAQFYKRPFHCWFEPGHGALALPEAIRQSCNIYFYNLGMRMKIDDIARYAEDLGLGRKTGVDIAGEKTGLVPSTEWKRRTQGAVWYPGETISVAIGQGPLQVTPLQVAAMMSCIANRGTRLRPHLLLEEDATTVGTAGKSSIPAATFEKVIEGMWRSANMEGTGRSAKVEKFDVCGKTGSTQLIGRETSERLGIKKKTHSWFAGFAPRTDPRIVIAVLVEMGGMGGETAAPVAGRLFKIYKDKYDRPGPAQGN
jgi:penicillin-binding protein 2